jgi:hypothetical protein
MWIGKLADDDVDEAMPERGQFFAGLRLRTIHDRGHCLFMDK